MTNTLQHFIARARQLQRSASRSNEHVNQLNEAAFNTRLAEPRLTGELSNIALSLAAANDYERGRAFALRNIGLYQLNTDQYQLAADTLEQSRCIFHRLQDQTGLAAAINNIGEAQMRLGQHEQALDNFLLAYRLYESLNDKHRVASSLSSIGMIYRRMGSNMLALENYYRGLGFADDAGSPLLKAHFYNNLGNIFWRMDEADEAIEHLQQALPIFESYSSRQGKSAALLNLGAAHLARQQYADALLYLERSLSLARELGNLRLQAEAQMRLGLLLRETDDLAEAAMRLEQALQTAQTIGSRSDEAEVLVEFGLLSRQTGDLSEARQLLEQAAEISAEFGYKEVEYKAQLGLSQVCEAAGDAGAALRHHQAFYRASSAVRGREPSLALGRVWQQYKVSGAMPPSHSELPGRRNQATSEPFQPSGLVPRKLQQVLEHITHNLGQNLTVTELASVAGLAEKYFQQKFKQSTGRTPHQFVVEQRVEAAKRLLESSQMPLAEVAVQCGFSNHSHMTVQFRLLTGVKPSNIRKKKKSN